jgi:hypothetical protein
MVWRLAALGAARFPRDAFLNPVAAMRRRSFPAMPHWSVLAYPEDRK